VEEKKEDCVKKQWVLYTNKDGEKVKVRDMLTKVAGWLDKFKEVGDVAVQFDASQASLPWAAVRALLQMTVNDVQTFGGMVESLEAISSIITRYTELETRVLIRTSQLTNQLSRALVKLYGAALRFLAQARRYYAKSTFRRAMKSAVSTAKHVVEEPMLKIEKYETEVYKLVSLVQSELTDNSLKRILEGIRDSGKDTGPSKEERRRKLSAWINGIDTKNTYETALQYHHEGTCEWVLNLGEFQAWNSRDNLKSNKARLLWIHGPPGFGKTFLSAWIVRHCLEQHEAKKAPVSYFFCVADNQLTRDPYAILRSWLAQLLEQSDSALSAMESVQNDRHGEQTVTHLGLWELFRAATTETDECIFILDGFDECVGIDTGTRYHRNDPRKYFLRDLIQNLKSTTSRVLVVSRDEPDINEYLAADSIFGGPDSIDRFEYAISSKDTAADVQSFSQFIVSNKLSKKTETLRQQIATQAAERSEGMFLWIKLLEQKISPGQNAKQLAKTVLEMPSGISEAYARELDKISQLPEDEKCQAVMVLRWVLFAVRPLKVKELAEALVVSDEDLEEYPEDDLPDLWQDGFVDDDYVNENMLSRCGSLLQLRSTHPDMPLADHTVHFVHFSVKEYLSSLLGHSCGTKVNNKSKSVITSPESDKWKQELGLADIDTEEVRLSNICLRYLTLGVFEEVPEDTSMYPFLSYASWAWYYHSYHEKPKPPPQDIMSMTQQAFDPSISSWKVW